MRKTRNKIDESSIEMRHGQKRIVKGGSRKLSPCKLVDLLCTEVDKLGEHHFCNRICHN